jgi:hypothetical protein
MNPTPGLRLEHMFDIVIVVGDRHRHVGRAASCPHPSGCAPNPRPTRPCARGRVSTEQADEVSEGAGTAPDAEDDLLDTAQRQPLHDLRRKVAQERAKADKDREERARRLHRQRSVRR